jgi:hypothetical protein
MFKGFLLYYQCLCHEYSSTLDENDVLNITKTRFQEYCGSPEYHKDVTNDANPFRKQPSTTTAPTASDSLTAQEFRKSVKRDKTHYSNLKDDKHFNSWNRSFVATAHMHHTHLVLDEHYMPTTPTEKVLFKELQMFMYAILEDHLKTDKGKSLISQYEHTRDVQSVYRELKKHARNSTAAQISGDTLLQYITTARFPGNWHGTSYGFVLHWKEQITNYFPPKQKLFNIQNSVSNIAELVYQMYL